MNNSWINSTDGKNRLYCGTNNTTYFGSGNGCYNWRGSDTVTDVMTLNNAGGLTILEYMTCYGVQCGTIISSASLSYTGGVTWHQNNNNYNGSGYWSMGIQCIYGVAAKDFLTFSDIRIKKNIQDINDDAALEQILAIQPKTYNYIDQIHHSAKTIYGFIAQQIAEVIPAAVQTNQVKYIPNIYQKASYDSETKIITISPECDYKFTTTQKDIKIEFLNQDSNQSIFGVITEVINDTQITISIDKKDSFTPNLFLIGTEVNDFHFLDKTYIFTLNVCATQDLHRKIIKQEEIIASLISRLEQLEKIVLNNTI